MRNVGVIGLGVIGKPIAIRLVQAGFQLAVYDVRREPVAELAAAGAQACSSPAAVAAASEIVISLVADAAQTRDIVSGPGSMIDTLRPGSILAVGSTLGPEPVIAVAKLLAARGCETVDAPISGGYLAAAEGNLSVMTGGEPAVIERALPVLRAFARSITRAGGVGAGQTAKLAHQLVCSVNVITLLEGLALGAAGGVEPAVLRQILAEGIARSGTLELWGEVAPRWKKMLQATPEGAPLPNLRKDLHLVLDLARELGVDLHLTPRASEIADSGIAAGHDNPAL